MFRFTPIMEREQNEGGIFLFDVGRHGVTRMAVLPTFIHDRSRVTWAGGNRGQQILARLQRISDDLDTDYRAEFHRQRLARTMPNVFQVARRYARMRNLVGLWSLAKRVRWYHLRLLFWAGLRRLAWLVGNKPAEQK